MYKNKQACLNWNNLKLKVLAQGISPGVLKQNNTPKKQSYRMI